MRSNLQRLFGWLQTSLLCLTLLNLCALYVEAGRAKLVLADTTFVFATVAEGRKALGRRDDFINQLSPFDRSARLKTDREVSKSELLDFVKQQLLGWTEAEKKQMAYDRRWKH